MERNKAFMGFVVVLLIGVCLGIPISGAPYGGVSINHWTHDTDNNFLVPTNTSVDVSLDNNSLLYANLSSFAGANISWSGNQFHVSADGTSKWNRAGTTVYTKIDNDDVQVNGTINGTDGEFTDLDVVDRLDVGGDIVVVDDIWCDVAYTRTVGVESSVYHIGDPDTFWHFNTDELYFKIDNFLVLKLLNETSTFYNNVLMNRNLTVSDTVTASYFVGDGSGLTNVNASNITGTIIFENISCNNISEYTEGYGIHLLNDTTVDGDLTVDDNFYVDGITVMGADGFRVSPTDTGGSIRFNVTTGGDVSMAGSFYNDGNTNLANILRVIASGTDRVNITGQLNVDGTLDMTGSNITNANLSEYAGDNIDWDSINMEFDAVAGAVGLWNDDLTTYFTKVDGRAVKLNSTLEVDGDFTANENISFGNQRIYNTSDDLYINNSASDKDIIISVNSGGVQKDFITINSLMPYLLLDAGDFSGSPSAGILTITGNNYGSIAPMNMKFTMNQYDDGIGYVSYGQLNLLNDSGGGGYVYYANPKLTVNPVSGNYNLNSYVADNSLGNLAITSADSTVNARFGYYRTNGGASLIGVPSVDTGLNLNIMGLDFIRDPVMIFNYAGGSWESVNSYGLRFTGWGGESDTTTGINTTENHVLHSDGGDVTFENCDFNQSGGDALINNIYGESNYHYHGGSALTFGIENHYYNLSFNSTWGNGIYCADGENITFDYSGVYSCNFRADGTGQNNHEYYLTVSVNDVPNENVEVHKKLTSGGDILPMGGFCHLNITAGDNVNLVIKDADGTGAGTYVASTVNFVRIGNL